jgi:hypothetical protein
LPIAETVQDVVINFLNISAHQLYRALMRNHPQQGATYPQREIRHQVLLKKRFGRTEIVMA